MPRAWINSYIVCQFFIWYVICFFSYYWWKRDRRETPSKMKAQLCFFNIVKICRCQPLPCLTCLVPRTAVGWAPSTGCWYLWSGSVRLLSVSAVDVYKSRLRVSEVSSLVQICIYMHCRTMTHVKNGWGVCKRQTANLKSPDGFLEETSSRTKTKLPVTCCKCVQLRRCGHSEENLQKGFISI